MGEGERANGRFCFCGDILAGYVAPDEDEERPLSEAEVRRFLYFQEDREWQQVQVEIPKGLRSIGCGAFQGCQGLTAVIVPDTIKEIGDRAFCACYSLRDVSIPDSVALIGEKAFFNCPRLTSLAAGAGVKRIGTDAFAFCTGLRQVTISGSTTIGDQAFYGCTSLARVFITGDTKRIGNNAFWGCTGLEEIILPKSLCSQKHVQRIFGDMKQLSWEWLSGKLQANEPLAAVFAEDLRSRRARIWGRIYTAGDVGLLERFLALWDKVPLDFLDKRIERAMEAKRYEFVTVLLQYKNDHYLHEQLPPENGAS